MPRNDTVIFFELWGNKTNRTFTVWQDAQSKLYCNPLSPGAKPDYSLEFNDYYWNRTEWLNVYCAYKMGVVIESMMTWRGTDFTYEKLIEGTSDMFPADNYTMMLGKSMNKSIALS